MPTGYYTVVIILYFWQELKHANPLQYSIQDMHRRRCSIDFLLVTETSCFSSLKDPPNRKERNQEDRKMYVITYNEELTHRVWKKTK